MSKHIKTYSDFTALVRKAGGEVNTDNPDDVIIRIPKSSFKKAFGFNTPKKASKEDQQIISASIQSLQEEGCGCGEKEKKS